MVMAKSPSGVGNQLRSGVCMSIGPVSIHISGKQSEAYLYFPVISSYRLETASVEENNYDAHSVAYVLHSTTT
jgi:hypothetical protein